MAGGCQNDGIPSTALTSKLQRLMILLTMSDSLEQYRKLYQELREPLGLKTPIEVVSGDWWYFDQRPDRETIIITTPEYHPDLAAPVFVHYMGHAKLLQDGWPRMKATVGGTEEVVAYLATLPEEQRKQIPLYWASRSEDSFFDFFVWRHVTKQLGVNWLERWLEAASIQNMERFHQFFGKDMSVGFDLYRYVYCLDWYGALSALAELYKLPVLTKLEQQAKAVSGLDGWSEDFKQKMTVILPWLRSYYRDIAIRFPSHIELLVDPKIRDEVFHGYYDTVWQDLPLTIQVTFK